jgi:hypothetical protein
VQVVDVYFPKDKHLNRRKNFCFVTFATQQVNIPHLFMHVQHLLSAAALLALASNQNVSVEINDCKQCVRGVMGWSPDQAAEKAAAQSDREINGYRIESISITHDRQEHYQRQAMSAAQQVREKSLK